MRKHWMHEDVGVLWSDLMRNRKIKNLRKNSPASAIRFIVSCYKDEQISFDRLYGELLQIAEDEKEMAEERLAALGGIFEVGPLKGYDESAEQHVYSFGIMKGRKISRKLFDLMDRIPGGARYLGIYSLHVDEDKGFQRIIHFLETHCKGGSGTKETPETIEAVQKGFRDVLKKGGIPDALKTKENQRKVLELIDQIPGTAPYLKTHTLRTDEDEGLKRMLDFLDKHRGGDADTKETQETIKAVQEGLRQVCLELTDPERLTSRIQASRTDEIESLKALFERMAHAPEIVVAKEGVMDLFNSIVRQEEARREVKELDDVIKSTYSVGILHRIRPEQS